MLAQRNHEGKTPIYLAIEHKSEQVYTFMFDSYPNMEIFTHDTF